ncbi:SDR family NAD(P)-dependent oxidoreductase [Paenibacillus aestuarii]|uniref:SDR family NAD(P)-dependent oxidoreductase n=1 Tax=Paenibacillus aestuarii TaxID=516965 RepID=A0ABW0K345_9BACL|nr:SDR family NAD(P)-dependent oxidoreductase [Paenibacillus aestuarii]
MMTEYTNWTVEGKYVMITGATSGIGFAAAKELASRGANLGIIARNPIKANEVAAELKALARSGATVDVFIADLSSQQSIREVAKDILQRWPKLEVMINNAGAMYDTRKMTVDGIEMTWAVNHLAPCLLTMLLLDRLKASGPARIITTASHGHKMARVGIRFEDLNANKLYSFPNIVFGGASVRYGETKLANIMFTAELGKHLEGTGVRTACLDPGLVSTNFNQENGWVARLTMSVLKRFSRTAEKGAETLVWLADCDEALMINGGYYKDQQLTIPSAHAQNVSNAKRLWNVSMEQTGVHL